MSNAEDIICAVTNRMLITVGTMLLENRAMLLPSILSDFTQYAKDLIIAKCIQEPQELKSISSRWILSEVTAKFQHHVTYICKVRKHGPLVYRPTSDLLTLLSEAMWKLKQLRTCIEPIRNEGLEAHVQTCAGSTDTCDQASTDALYFHWKRTCWVLDMWGQADRNVTVLEPVTEYGWTVEDRNHCITWDTDENMKTVRERVSLLLRGCKCVTGCKKKDTTCTEGCQCTNCENQVSPREERDELPVIALEEEVHSSGHMDLEERDEFAEFVFAATFDTDSESNIDNHDV